MRLPNDRTLLDEYCLIKDRETSSEPADQIQADLDEFLAFYNLKCSHQACRSKGQTPAQALRDALGRNRLQPIVPKGPALEIAEAAQSGLLEISSVE